MKSIVQEASSVAKAIEKSLEKASNPRDFSVKILEYPEKNFFGLTTKPAKIALYFDDKNRKPNDAHPLIPVDKDDIQRIRTREKGRSSNQIRKQVPTRKQQDYPPVVSETIKPKVQEVREPAVDRQRRDESVVRWNPEIIDYAKEWLTRVLTEMHHLVPFELGVDRFHIKIILERPLFEDAEQERRVLASLSLLMLETCKHKFKVNLRDHRVILTHRNQNL